MTCRHACRDRADIDPGNRAAGAVAACRRGVSRPSHPVRLHFTKGYPNG
jgi:hypothetical protein